MEILSKYKYTEKEQRELKRGMLVYRYKHKEHMVTDNDINKYIGKIFSSKNYGDFKVIGINGKTSDNAKVYICEFIDTGFQILAGSSRIKTGAIKDYLLPNVFGVGYLGYISNTKSARSMKEYIIWHSMLRRCYSDNYQGLYPTYIGVKVDENWHCFENFLNDYCKILGHDSIEKHKDFNFDLDKDMLTSQNVYSLDTCCFIPRKLNKFFNIPNSNSSGYTGVSESGNSWVVNITKDNNPVKLGSYKTKEAAYSVYVDKKFNILNSYLKGEFAWLDTEIKKACLSKFGEIFGRDVCKYV